jgi:hypothetical protein
MLGQTPSDVALAFNHSGLAAAFRRCAASCGGGGGGGAGDSSSGGIGDISDLGGNGGSGASSDALAPLEEYALSTGDAVVLPGGMTGPSGKAVVAPRHRSVTAAQVSDDDDDAGGDDDDDGRAPAPAVGAPLPLDNTSAPVVAHLHHQLDAEWRAHMEEWHGHAVVTHALAVGMHEERIDEVCWRGTH